MKDGSKEAEMKFSDAEEWEKLALIQSMLDFLGVSTSFKDMAEVYFKTSERFKEFLESQSSAQKQSNGTSPLELLYPVSEFSQPPEPVVSVVSEPIPVKPLRSSSSEGKSKLYYKTGIIRQPNGKPLYKCRYRCECGKSTNHYISPDQKTVFCHECQRPMDVVPATPFGIVDPNKNPEIYRDSFGNFFIAGLMEPEIRSFADRF
ncbi:hypothetical protein [Bacillus sp. FSL K6-6540]|uniref:hypothetical protein n=1 Tax=Bacillus sp. FSL K6-6540 TaxID=2921512 RepID=UPI0030F7F179